MQALLRRAARVLVEQTEDDASTTKAECTALACRIAEQRGESLKRQLIAMLVGMSSKGAAASTASLGLGTTALDADGTSAGSVPPGYRIGLDELALERRIGSGSSGTTYLAAWQGVRVAVKVSSKPGSAYEGWRAEVAALVQLHHPNIVRCLGAVQSPPTYCVVLEYCEAGDLRRVLQRPTPPSFFWHVAEGVVRGMAFLHRRGILHAT